MCLKGRRNVFFWLQADIQQPEIEVRSTLRSGHSKRGWKCLKVTRNGHMVLTNWPDSFLSNRPSSNDTALFQGVNLSIIVS